MDIMPHLDSGVKPLPLDHTSNLHTVADPLLVRRHGSNERIGGTMCSVAATMELSRDRNGAEGGEAVISSQQPGPLAGQRDLAPEALSRTAASDIATALEMRFAAWCGSKGKQRPTDAEDGSVIGLSDVRSTGNNRSGVGGPAPGDEEVTRWSGIEAR